MYQMIYLGNNLLPEGLETGEYKIQNSYGHSLFNPVWVVAYTGDKIGEEEIPQSSFVVNGIAQSVAFLITTSPFSYAQLMNTLNNTENASSYILSCFSVPHLAVSTLLNSDNMLSSIPNVYLFAGGKTYEQPETYSNFGNKPTSIDGYTPRNKKLLTYPYCYMAFSTQNASQKIYRYENFENDNLEFGFLSELNPNPQVCVIPQNYRGKSDNNILDMAVVSGYPQLSSRSDNFNNWLAQNSQIVSLQMQQEQYNTEANMYKTGMDMLSSMGSAISNPGNALGIVEGAMNLGITERNYDFYVKQQMAQIEKQAMLPDQANLSSSNATLLGYNEFEYNIFYNLSIKSEFAERIDKYFDMYGYLTNTVKIPNLNNRTNWNYIKTIGVNILGDIPGEDLQTIKQFFDNGITLWHNPNTFLDYSQNNR